MKFHRFRRFGRIVFDLYHRRPILMNSLVGSGVYGGAEAIAQHQAGQPKLDAQRIVAISALGAFEVGWLMTVWYNALDRWIGVGGRSEIVLAKCAADQLFFATQGDSLFLALCACFDSKDLPEAVREVKRNFLTIWLNDLAVWPLVNSVGFWAVPTQLLPTYMAVMQLLWQLYLSSTQQEVVAPSAELESVIDVQAVLARMDDKHLDLIFSEFDVDGSGLIDANELQSALLRCGLTISTEGIHKMMHFGDVDGNGCIDRAEFKRILSNSAEGTRGEDILWALAIARSHHKHQMTLEKGGAIARIKGFMDHDKPGQAQEFLASEFKSAWAELITPLAESEKDEEWRRTRADAWRNSAVGLSMLIGGVGMMTFFRKFRPVVPKAA